MGTVSTECAAWIGVAGTVFGVGLSGLIELVRDVRRRADDRETLRLRNQHEQELRYNAERLTAYVEFTSTARLFCIRAKNWVKGAEAGRFVEDNDLEVINCSRWLVRALVLAKPPLTKELRTARDRFTSLLDSDRQFAAVADKNADLLLQSANAIDNAVKQELEL